MSLKLGFFRDFKAKDTVLLEGSSSDIEHLVLALNTFVSSKEQSLPIHNLASVAAHHPVMLFVGCSSQLSVDLQAPQFEWHIPSTELYNVEAKLLALAQTSNGHQYFELNHSSAQLIVSSGEYGESWWHTNG